MQADNLLRLMRECAHRGNNLALTASQILVVLDHINAITEDKNAAVRENQQLKQSSLARIEHNAGDDVLPDPPLSKQG